MSTNFNSFDVVPVNSIDKYSESIFISAQDRLEEIFVDLKAFDCEETVEADQPWTWENLSLAGFEEVRMFIKQQGSEELHAEIVGVPLAPLEGGQVLFRFSGATFGLTVGLYVGLVEVEYKGSKRSGNKIINARNYIPFEVREDFYCDPYDPDFPGACA